MLRPAAAYFHAVPAFVADRLGIYVHLDPEALRTVVYVGLEANGKFLPLGTGFIIGVRHKESDFHFIATADHVVDLVTGPSIWVRMNTRDGVAGPTMKIEKNAKLPIDRKLDLAILPLPQIGPTYMAGSILIDRVQYNSILEDIWKPELGLEVATVGLYTSHFGQVKNIPVVRVGHIALLPDEPVLTTRGFIQAYLVETRTIAGLSGSPVFLNIPHMRVHGTKVEIREGIGLVLMGMMLGYHLVASADDQIIVPANQGDDARSGKPSLDDRNTGFAVVIPIERIFDVMESDDIKKALDGAIDRDLRGARYREAGAALKPVSAAKIDPSPKDENPQHREDFTSLLGKAARTPPQDG